MFAPGAYRPDPSEGITTPAELIRYYRSDTRQPCPRCGHSAYRDKEHHRTLHDLGNLDLWCPRDLVVTYSQHDCTKCRKYFNYDLSDLASPGSHYTHRVIDLAVRLVVEDGLPYRAQPVGIYGETTGCSCPLPPSKTGGGWGKRRRASAWTASFSTGPWLIFQAMWRPMNSTMAPTVFCPPWLIAVTSASSMRS